MHLLPMPEAEHSVVLIDELGEQIESMCVIGFVDCRLTVSGDVEFGRPARIERHDSQEFTGEHRRINESLE